MKKTVLAVCFAFALAAATGAIEPQPPTVESLDAEVQALTDQLQEATDQLRSLQERLDTVEQRLGDSFGGVSSFNTIERRLDDLQNDVDELKRR